MIRAGTSPFAISLSREHLGALALVLKNGQAMIIWWWWKSSRMCVFCVVFVLWKCNVKTMNYFVRNCITYFEV